MEQKKDCQEFFNLDVSAVVLRVEFLSPLLFPCLC